jgi:hypothetical protein
MARLGGDLRGKMDGVRAAVAGRKVAALMTVRRRGGTRLDDLTGGDGSFGQRRRARTMMVARSDRGARSDNGGRLQTWEPVGTAFMARAQRMAVSPWSGDPVWHVACQVETAL